MVDVSRPTRPDGRCVMGGSGGLGVGCGVQVIDRHLARLAIARNRPTTCTLCQGPTSTREQGCKSPFTKVWREETRQWW